MYSEQLIKEVKECYPDYERIHQLADKGSVWLGRYLCDNIANGISIDRVLSAKTLQELQDQAMHEKRKQQCYEMWCNEDPRKK